MMPTSSQTMRSPLWMGFTMLLGSLLASPILPAQAQEQFDADRIQFDANTVVEFEFVESNGVYQSIFGVINLITGERTPLIRETRPADAPPLATQDDLGTPGNAVPQPLAEFEFQANVPYAFYLESFYNDQPAGLFYSTTERNPRREIRVQFGDSLPALAAGGILLFWDDSGSLLVEPSLQDRDFNDFIIRAGGHLACPYDEIIHSEGNPTASTLQASANLSCSSATTD